MIDGQFPAYEKVIPKSNDKRIEFDKRPPDERGAPRRAAVERAVARGQVRDRQGKVEVTSSSPEFGDAREPLPVDYDGRRSPSASTRSMCSTS
jgi:DNA polymerase III subunit beta